MTDIGDKLVAAGVEPPLFTAKIFNEDAAALLAKILSSGWRMVPANNSFRSFDFVDEHGNYLPHRLILDGRGTWHILVGVKI